MNAPANSEILFATADRTLLAPYGLDAVGLTRVFGQILSHQVDYADLYFQYSRGESWSLEEGIVKSGSFHIEQGVGVRAVSGEKTAFAYSDDISLPALESAAQATRAIARQGAEGSTGVTRRNEGRALYLPHDPIASLKDSDKVALLERLERMARARDPRVQAGHRQPGGRVRGGARCALGWCARGRRAPAGPAVVAGDRRGGRAPRAGLGGRWRALRLRLFQRRDAARATPTGQSTRRWSICRHGRHRPAR